MEIIKKFIPVLILLAVSWYTHVFTMMQQRPQSVHMWAMCDRGSVARNFAQESMDFFIHVYMKQRRGMAYAEWNFR